MLSQEERKNLFDLLQSNDVTNIEVALQIGEGTQTHLYLDEFEKLWDFLTRVKCGQIPPWELSLAEKIGELMQIETLVLELRESEVIPDGICFLKNLQNLSITAYDEVYLPKVTTYLENLTELHLHLRNSNKLPAAIFELTQLETLNLSFSAILEISHNIFNLQNLQTLNLTYCLDLHTIPYEVYSLQRLHTLYIGFTSIQEISPAIAYSNLFIFGYDTKTSVSLFRDTLFSLKLMRFNDEENLLSNILSRTQFQNIPSEVTQGGLKSIKAFFKKGN